MAACIAMLGLYSMKRLSVNLERLSLTVTPGSLRIASVSGTESEAPDDICLQLRHFFTNVEIMRQRDISNFELMILLALIRLGDNAYGVPISLEIEKCARRHVALGSVYAALERLEKKGLVASRLGEATAERGGKPKRFFHVTGKGLRDVRATQRALDALWDGLPELSGG
jgi:DNA-binding PadR family transcriptional regulator